MSRYALLATSPSFEERFVQATAGPLEGQVTVWDRENVPSQPAQVLVGVTSPALLDVVVLGDELDPAEALRMAAAFEVHRPELSILMVAEPTPELVVSAMRAGVREVVRADASVQDLTGLLHRATRSAAIRRRGGPGSADDAGSGRGRVIAVLSPKGGSGKTTVATNLAVGLAREEPNAVVLVDLDLQFGDVATALQLYPQHTVADAVQPAAQRDSMVMKSYLTTHPEGLYVVCAPESPAEADDISSQQVTQLIDQLAEQYPYVVIDTAPGLTEHTLGALDATTDLVLVGGLDVPSVRGLHRELDVLRMLDLGILSRHIVLNSADPRNGLSRSDAESTLGAKVDVVVPEHRAMRVATNQGVPILISSPRNRAARELERLIPLFHTDRDATAGQRARHRKDRR
ncbi:CpaE family protein [Citricoccus sp. GCM10030269]|uniref:AAA family ATPase n=1 Tax=Citricoccus sp. GCM10030269 TaxID=3273388 RepID=UPI0036077358